MSMPHTATIPGSGASPRIWRRQQQTRQAVLQAAAGLFVERGVHAVSVEDILEAADISRATYYKFFRNRNDVAAQIIRPMFERLGADLAAIDTTDPERIIDGIIAVYQQAWSEAPEALLLATRDGPSLYELFDDVHRLVRDRLRQLFRLVEPHGILLAGKADYAVTLLARTAVTILRVYADDPEWKQLFATTMRGYLLKAHNHR